MITPKIPLKLLQAAHEFRKVKGWSLQRLIREALTEFLRRHKALPEDE